MSVGAAQSPEDQAYLEKLKQLSKYIDPLRRMVRRIDTEEGKIVLIDLEIRSFLL